MNRMNSARFGPPIEAAYAASKGAIAGLTTALAVPAGDVLDLGRVEVAAGTLVGQRAVDEPVGDHHLAPVEGRLHDRVDVLGLVGGVEQRLGAVARHHGAAATPRVGGKSSGRRPAKTKTG